VPLDEHFLRSVVLRRERIESFDRYPFAIPSIRNLEELDLSSGVTIFVGENGSGKSTLVEALAVAAGFNPEGGSRNFSFGTRASHSELHEHLQLVKGVRSPRDGFFLRAESLFNVASEIEALEEVTPGLIASSYGGKSLHEQSHGESFLSLVVHRFRGDGLYILDEPEAALSVRGCLALIRRMHDLVADGSQFVLATHSPILAGFPGARIYRVAEDGIDPVEYEETDLYDLTRAFLDDRARFLHHLLADDDPQESYA
jgi:predicted ATPase